MPGRFVPADVPPKRADPRVRTYFYLHSPKRQGVEETISQAIVRKLEVGYQSGDPSLPWAKPRGTSELRQPRPDVQCW